MLPSRPNATKPTTIKGRVNMAHRIREKRLAGPATRPNIINVLAVKKANAGAEWAQDIVASYKSATFRTAIQADRFYDGFTLPDYMK